MPAPFRLAHVTDPHFRPASGPLTGMTMADLLNKRVVGMANLVLNRRRHHRMELLAGLAVDLRARKPDHLAVTGDLSNVSLAAEWAEARQWLAGLQLPDAAVTVIPGNHDVYLEEVAKDGRFEAMFAAYQTAELRGAEHYPFVRVRGDVALVAVNSCVATGDLGAWGEIGAPQLQRLEQLLSSPALAGKTRVVLLHHPPVLLKGAEQRNLRDRTALAEVLARTGAELVLHGHDHRDERATLAGPGGKAIPVVGAGSASYAGSADKRSRYNVYEIAGGHITAITFRHDEQADRFVEAKRETLA
jgi:3',5'-cyclic AMP phosphodiesterase CpdA